MATSDNVAKLALFSIVLGAIYMGIFAIELFGLLSAASNRLPLVRTYAYLSAVSALAVVAVGIIDIVVHFSLQNQIISLCSDFTEGEDLVYFGFFGPVYRTNITPSEAQDYCTSLWKHDSWTTVIAFLITSFLAVLFSSIAFSYLHQLLDPASPANSARAPSNQVRLSGYQSSPAYNVYAPSYIRPYDGQPYNTYYGGGNPATGPYAPPPGPPPAHEGYQHGERDEPFVPPADGKPPSYTGYGKEFEASDDKEDPFDVPERDVTSRPSPGGRERFT
ncbi:hypothetical protein AX15_007044 [Amanita polypyramis BW_CC]|nr:hypothetical protein AX15_007044 [Amanita polypyramis BW_CC]